MTYTINLSSGIVTRDSDGLQVAPTQSVTEPIYVQYLDWVNAGNSPTEYTAPVAGPTPKITVLAFRNRFTQAEKITMDLASIDNPSGTIQQRQMAASLRVTSADLSAATYVDVTRPDTIASIQNLETYGVIGVGRAAQILSTTVHEIEIAQ